MSLTTKILFLIYLYWTTASGSELDNTTPILKIRPTSPDGSGLIWFDSKDQNSTQHYINDLNKFLEPYIKSGQSPNGEECEQTHSPKKDKFCSFKINENMGRCISELQYGFNRRGDLCIFLQLTQFPKNWVPQFYNSTDAPKEMPENLKSAILESEQQSNQQNLWVSCDGETPADKELIGPVQYLPSRGFPVNYLLNSQVEGYRSPLIAVHFQRPKRGILINVMCTVWAKNIPRDPKLQVGTVRFGIIWDD